MEEGCDNSKIYNEVLIHNNIIPMNKILKICNATLKIELENGDIGSGFFLKTLRNNKSFHCLMTNEHIISSDLVENKEKIKIKFENETKKIEIELNNEERIIILFETIFKLDIAIIQIINKDNIEDSYFLSPYNNFEENNNNFIGKEIIVTQYPQGSKISLSKGKILKNISDFMFFHDSDTENGSSGGPIILQGDDKVLAIHKGYFKGDKEQDKKNIGIFIGIIIDILRDYKRNGKYKDFYENGEVKYEGNFVDDEYEDNEAIFRYENGDYYVGPFKNGKKNGNGFEYNKEGKIKYEGNFENDEYEGEGKFYYENDEIFLGLFKKGKKDGKGHIIKDGELIKEVEYKNDELINSNEVENVENNVEKEKLNENKEEKDNNEINLDKSQDIKNEENKFNFKKDVIIQAHHVFHGLGNLLGIVCKRCGHHTKSHETIGYGQWICNDCPKEDNDCSILKK